MKKYCFFLLLAFSNICHGQNKKNQVDIGFGPSIPLGNYASLDPANEASGYARVGFAFDLNLQIGLHRNFGIVISNFLHRNPANHQNLVDEISQQEPGGGSIIEGGWGKQWEINGFMIGGYYLYNLTERFNIQGKAMFGIWKIGSPEFHAYNLNGPDGNPWEIEQLIANSQTTPVYVGQVMVTYRLDHDILLTAGINYCTSNPEFRDRVRRFSFFGNTETTFKQRIQALGLTIGIGYAF